MPLTTSKHITFFTASVCFFKKSKLTRSNTL